MRTLRLSILALLAGVVCTIAASAAPLEVRREITFPDLPGYQTLVCDLHMHTVFSDGNVWPTVRVDEAWRQGLDVISITDHIEYQPHKADVPTQHNRPYDLAANAAKAHNLIFIKGAEITRDTPPGHFNALFLSDIAKLDTPEFLDAVKAAVDQGAFVFWNHQGWKGEEKGQWMDVHQTMFDRKWFQGMEVANGDEYYPTAHKWCLEKGLTMLGNSDIHAPDLRRESSSQDHRTMTLVFVKERSAEGIKEALLARRTIVWYKEQLIGREELLRPFFEACIVVSKPSSRSKSSVLAEVRNVGQADIELERPGAFRLDRLVLPAGTTCMVKFGLDGPDKPVTATYTAKNFIVAPGQAMEVTLTVPEE